MARIPTLTVSYSFQTFFLIIFGVSIIIGLITMTVLIFADNGPAIGLGVLVLIIGKMMIFNDHK
jgi:hypothetical protein